MIAAWMVYGGVLGALAVFAALPLERFALRRGGPTRWVWAGALVTTVSIPFAAAALKEAPSPGARGDVLAAAFATSPAVDRSLDVLEPLDGPLMAGWLGSSAALALLLLGGLAATAWRARRWTPSDVDGTPVLVSDDTGPAVVGFASSFIVVPRWVLSMSDHEREMMLRHEMEHLRSGDPFLILLGVLMVVALPWNPAIWFMAHRLRLAVEVDCDRRVLRGGQLDTRRYAELLLTVGARRAVPVYGVGFSLGRPLLEERIDRMTLPSVERKRAHSMILALGVAGVIAAAWSLPQPIRTASGEHVSCPADTSPLTRALLESVAEATS